jgi:hypothetical protein
MAKADLTAERLRELLSYDPETGVFRRIVQVGTGRRAGSIAGALCDGYVVIHVASKRYKAHRLAWLHVHGTWPTGEIDHRNGLRADNRIVNLRDVSQSVNLQNQRYARVDSITRLRGASPLRGKYAAQIFFNGRQHYLGLFATPEEAHDAYLVAKRKFHEGCTI